MCSSRCTQANCNRAFTSKFKLDRHILIHSSTKQHGCPYCSKSFARKDHLKNHLKIHDPQKKMFECSECNKQYASSHSYRVHQSFHAAERGERSCQMCKKEFESKEALVTHIKYHLGAKTPKENEEKKQTCPLCDKLFSTKKDVRRHLIVHTKKRDFLCQFCPQRFGRRDHLVRHVNKTHSSDCDADKAAEVSSSPQNIVENVTDGDYVVDLTNGDSLQITEPSVTSGGTVGDFPASSQYLQCPHIPGTSTSRATFTIPQDSLLSEPAGVPSKPEADSLAEVAQLSSVLPLGVQLANTRAASSSALLPDAFSHFAGSSLHLGQLSDGGGNISASSLLSPGFANTVPANFSSLPEASEESSQELSVTVTASTSPVPMISPTQLLRPLPMSSIQAIGMDNPKTTIAHRPKSSRSARNANQIPAVSVGLPPYTAAVTPNVPNILSPVVPVNIIPNLANTATSMPTSANASHIQPATLAASREPTVTPQSTLLQSLGLGDVAFSTLDPAALSAIQHPSTLGQQATLVVTYADAARLLGQTPEDLPHI